MVDIGGVYFTQHFRGDVEARCRIIDEELKEVREEFKLFLTRTAPKAEV